MISYPTIYTDARGTENTAITNDGKTLTMWLRGVEFTGGCFEGFIPSEEATPEQLEQFSICLDWLCSYRIEFQMPIAI